MPEEAQIGSFWGTRLGGFTWVIESALRCSVDLTPFVKGIMESLMLGIGYCDLYLWSMMESTEAGLEVTASPARCRVARSPTGNAEKGMVLQVAIVNH